MSLHFEKSGGNSAKFGFVGCSPSKLAFSASRFQTAKSSGVASRGKYRTLPVRGIWVINIENIESIQLLVPLHERNRYGGTLKTQ